MRGFVDNPLVVSSKFALLLISASLRSDFTAAGATCNNDQIAACRTAARGGLLSDYAGSGQCVVKPYVQYTHLCTVSDYEPSVDHCCCPLADDRVMCCRYHQAWYHFRCTESDDAIDLRSSESCRWTMTSWQVLVLLFVLISLFVVVVSCICICWRLRIAARRRSVRPETSHEFSVTSDSDYAGLLHCCKWNKADEKTVARSTNSSSLSSAVRPRTRPPTDNSAPIYSTSGAIEPSAPPVMPDASSMPFDEMGLDCSPYAACPHRCRTCFRCSSLLAADMSSSSSSSSSRDVINWTCVCGATMNLERFCSPTDDDLLPPPSYEMSQQLHSEQTTPSCSPN